MHATLSRRSVLNRKALWIALLVIIGGFAIAAYTLYSPGGAVRFTPTEGEVRDYAVASRVEIIPEDASRANETSSTGVLRYRVDHVGESTRLRVTPELLEIKRGYQTLFSSSEAEDGNAGEVADMLRDGFDLTIDADGKSDIALVDQDKIDALEIEAPGLTGDAFQTQIVDPTIAASLPAREGAEVRLDAYRGMHDVAVKVTRVTDDSVSLQITGRADTLDNDNPISRQLAGLALDARISDVRLEARVRLDRATGWLESMAAVSHMNIRVGDHSAAVRSLAYAVHREDLATGLYADGLSNLITGPSFDEDREYPIPQTQAQAQDESPTAPTELDLDARNPVFMADGHRLGLAFEVDAFDEIPFGSLELTDITLYDDQDQPLNIPLVFDTLDYDSRPDNPGALQIFRLRSLGWNTPALDRVARVEAQLEYTPTDAGEKTKLKLGEQPTQVGEDRVKVTAKPVANEDDSWWVDLYTSGTAYYWPDSTTPQPGLSARTLGTAHDSWLSTTEEIALARVDQPLTWIQHFKVQSDHTPAELALRHAKTSAESRAYRVSFRDFAARYSNRDLAPPEKKTLSRPDEQATPAEGPVAFDDVHTEDADKNRLRLVLPEGLAGACELTADAPALAGHALVWQPRPSANRYGRRADDEDAPGEQTWELATDDGVRTYFYGIEVQTTLACPGTPRWQRIAIDSDKPWLIDLKAVTGRTPDPQRSAAAFFGSIRFYDADGHALRPMRKDAAPDQRLDDWPTEASEHALDDYMYDDGVIRLWGAADHVMVMQLDGEPRTHSWHDELKALP